MKVYFDDQIFHYRQAVGGISRYFVELLRAFSNDDDFGVKVVSAPVWTHNAHMVDAGMTRRLSPQLASHPKVIRSINRLCRRAGSSDIVHHTQYNRRYLDRYRRTGYRVITVYDMIPEVMPELFPHHNPHLDKRLFVDAADLIFCISEATKIDLVDLYGLPAAPIIVTPLGVDQSFRPGLPKPPFLPAQYVLYVGSRAEYKDFGVLAQAFAESGISGSVTLVVAGGGAFNESEKADLTRLGISARVHRVDLDDGDLKGAYANALCFAFPSRYEGFGLPTLEAMASGCPTILARSSSHPEVGGDAAVYFAPGDHDELASALHQLVTKSPFREERRLAGIERAGQFSWHETARRTASAYGALLTGS